MKQQITARQDENGETYIEMGWFLKGIILAGALGAVTTIGTIIIGFPALSQKVEEQAEKERGLESAQQILRENQGVIDEEVRNLKADSTWTQRKLDALLEAGGVTKRIPRPAVEDSKLE